jgi:fluoride ion exporter CrcB/FEX
MCKKSPSASCGEHNIRFLMHFLSRIEKPVHSSLKSVQEEKMKCLIHCIRAEQLPPTYFCITHISPIQLSNVQWMNCLLLTTTTIPTAEMSILRLLLGLSDHPKPFKIVHNVGTGILGVFGAFSTFASQHDQWCQIHNQSSRYITSLSTRTTTIAQPT